MLIRLDTHLSCISTGSVMLYFACAFLPEKLSLLPTIILVIYILDFTAACIFSSFSGADKYLVNEHDRKAARAGIISTIWYIVIILAACATAAEQVILQKMENNSMDSLVWCGGFSFYLFFLQ